MSPDDFLPPTDGPSRAASGPGRPVPHAARSSAPPTAPATARGTVDALLVLGVVTIVLGLVSLLVQNAYKLDESLVLGGGGQYLKDGFRLILDVVGLAAIVAGALTCARARRARAEGRTRGLWLLAGSAVVVNILALLIAVAGLSSSTPT